MLMNDICFTVQLNIADTVGREHSGLVVEGLAGDLGAAGSSLTGVTASCP